MEPEKYLPFNRTELIARCEALEAELTEARKPLEAYLEFWKDRRIAALEAQLTAALRGACRSDAETSDPSKRTGPYTGDYDDLAGDRSQAETFAKPEPNTYTHPYMRKCNRCGKELRFKEPCLATVVYCDVICAD
jgi:hypothetical protein